MTESLPVSQKPGAVFRKNEPTADGPVELGSPDNELPEFRPFGQGIDDRSSFLPGAMIGGKYTLVRPLGAGGMGMVWVARNEATGGDVAIKLLLPRPAHDRAELLARFRREASLTAKMRHRAIVRVYDLLELSAAESGSVDSEEASIAIVMELLDGETLGRLLERQGTLTPRAATDVALSLLSALAHAHDAGIVHRDLKPENVFLSTDTDGCITPKILDFGISKIETNTAAPALTRDGDMVGTPSYMSPEQARSAPLDGRSDLFNVGIILYEMITGKNPFAGEGFHAVLVAILEIDPPPLPSFVPAELASVVMRALSKRPDDRFAGAREMSAALRAAIGDEAASSQPRLNVASLGESFSTRDAWKSLHEIMEPAPADGATHEPEPATIPVEAGPNPPPAVVIPPAGLPATQLAASGSVRGTMLEVEAPSAETARPFWRTLPGQAGVGAVAALLVVGLIALASSASSGSGSSTRNATPALGSANGAAVVADSVMPPSSTITASIASGRAVQNLEVVSPGASTVSNNNAPAAPADTVGEEAPPAESVTAAAPAGSASPASGTKVPSTVKKGKKDIIFRNPGF